MAAAKNDLAVIERIIDEERLSHMAAFHSQQSIEKCLRHFLRNSIEIPKIHKSSQNDILQAIKPSEGDGTMESKPLEDLWPFLDRKGV